MQFDAMPHRFRAVLAICGVVFGGASLCLTVDWKTDLANAALLAEDGAAAPQPPRVMAIVLTAAGPRLAPLDARTLALVRGGWSRAVGTQRSDSSGIDEVRAALSPSGSDVVVTGRGGSVIVFETATGRTVQNYGFAAAGDGLYWLGGDGTYGRPEPLLLAALFGCWSLGCGLEITVVNESGHAIAGILGEAVTALRKGLVFAHDPTFVDVYGGDVDVSVRLARMPRDAPFRVVADVTRGRLFAISSAGLVAEVEHVARRPAVTYHRVDLNGRPFDAAWAGAGRIALWGKDGLGTIDTRTWTTHTIAPRVTGAVATPSGIAAWTSDPADGLTVYRPDGTKRLHVLAGKRIHAAQAVGRYLYIEADARYSLNLSTGRVVGPLRSDAMIIGPSLVSIP